MIERLARLDTGAISDAFDRLDYPSGVVEHLHGIFPERRLCGRIRTITLASAGGHTSNSFHLGARTIASSKPGEVIVVANEGRLQAAAWGGMLSIAANLRQLPGVIVDGAVRDLDQIESLDFAVFARVACPRTARRRFVEVAFDEPIQIDGVRVETGDLVLADRSGVVFIPEASHTAIISTAEEIFEMEASLTELREDLQLADELFFVGTGWEILPIVEVDGLAVGSGKRGCVTLELQRLYQDIVHGVADSRREWLTEIAF